jgi:hypothetical protein
VLEQRVVIVIKIIFPFIAFKNIKRTKTTRLRVKFLDDQLLSSVRGSSWTSKTTST